jgi:uncharacterized protein (DUF1778 family)
MGLAVDIGHDTTLDILHHLRCYTDSIRTKTSQPRTDTPMPRTATTRDDRLELRVTKEEKRLLAAAAAYERLDVTAFIMRQALPAARDVITRNERIVLTERDSARVLELLENPPKPTAALLAAFRAFCEQTGQ